MTISTTARGSARRVLGASKRAARRMLLALEPRLRDRGLAVRGWRAWESVLTVFGRDGQLTEGGLALPPVALRVRVIANADAQLFVQSGRSDAAILTDACRQHGLEIADAGRLLDFGCGCGRVTRHWAGLSSLEVHGTDHDPDLIAWLQTGLPFVHAQRNGLVPPLAYPDDHFGVIYAVSVFTHMTDELARAWMAELHRIVRPGAIVLVTALDERQVDRLRPAERAAYARGEPVVQFEDALGTNMCVSYHPAAYIESIAAGFDLLSSQTMGAQKLYVLRAAVPQTARQAVAATDDG